jgi:HAD superfamily hydrolase (TIGR01509 family)
LRDALFSNDPQYLACKKGEISLDVFLKPYWQKWRKYPKFDLSLKQTKKDWFEFAKLNKKIIKKAEKLKGKGILNFIMTNNSRKRIEFLDRKYNLSGAFEIIGSFDLGVLKPDPIFYQVLKDKYGLKLSEILYFDDKKKTVDGLNELGFQARLYQNFAQFCRELKDLRVTV